MSEGGGLKRLGIKGDGSQYAILKELIVKPFLFTMSYTQVRNMKSITSTLQLI